VSFFRIPSPRGGAERAKKGRTISESFNSWIKDLKDLNVVDLVDQIRQRIMVTFDKRRIIGTNLKGIILPSVMQQLNIKSRNIKKISISRGGDKCAEVSGMDPDGSVWRHAVELDKQQCTCREWQLKGQPCIHAIAFICSIRTARLEDHVHEFYSIDKFQIAYAGVIKPMTDKSQWAKSDPGFKVHPPITKRPAGRPKKKRIPGVLELTSKKQQCKRCKQFGHQQRTCKEPLPEDASNSRLDSNKRCRILM
jgi:SWIM zinc finger